MTIDIVETEAAPRRRLRWYVAATAIVVLAALVAVVLVIQDDDGSPEPARSEELEQGALPPPGTAVGLDGTSIAVGASTGRPRAILFWATWCPPCGVDAIDRFQSAATTGGGDVGMVAVAFNDNEPDVRARFATSPPGLTVAFARDRDLRAWDIAGIPYWVFLDRRGRVLDHRAGPLANLDAVLAALAAGKKLPELRGMP